MGQEPEFKRGDRVRALTPLYSNTNFAIPDVPVGSTGKVVAVNIERAKNFSYGIFWDHLSKSGKGWVKQAFLEHEHLAEKGRPFRVTDIVRHVDRERAAIVIETGLRSRGGKPMIRVRLRDNDVQKWYVHKCYLVEDTCPIDLTKMSLKEARKHIRIGQTVKHAVSSRLCVVTSIDAAGDPILGDDGAVYADRCIITEQPQANVTIPKGTQVEKPDSIPAEHVQMKEAAEKYIALVAHAERCIPSFIKACNGNPKDAIAYALHAFLARKILWGDLNTPSENNIFMPKALNPGHVKRKSKVKVVCDYPAHLD
jgi:hypothetical protein